MSICVPKHVTCNWYIPTFTAGSTPCSLILYNETRSRLVIGGSFFRSIGVGPYTNNIQVANEWQVNDGAWRAYNSGSPNFDTLESVGRVELTITNGVDIEIYYADQTYVTDSWTVNAISSLRDDLLISSLLTTMPDNDVQQPWTFSTDDGDHLAEFVTSSLSGATGGPITQAGLDSIRTGPVTSMIFINDSEINNVDGTLTEIRETRYWNGACWKIYNPTIPDCTDPSLSIGSPPTGSPLLCELGPAADC